MIRLQRVLDLLRYAPFIQRRLPIGVRVMLLKDTPYEDIFIPKGTSGSLIDDDGDLYFPYVIEFDGYPDAYLVSRRDIEVTR